MKNIKLNFLTTVNLIILCLTISMFIYIIYITETTEIKNKRKFTNIEFNQLKYVEKSEVLESIRLINENFNQLYGMSFYITNSIPLMNYEDTSDYIAYTTDQLDSIFNSCKNKARKRYKDRYEKAYSYYIKSDY